MSALNGYGGNAADEHNVIFVSNLPLNLNKDNIQSLFEEYGGVTGVLLFKTGNRQSAYISYKNIEEAENAVHELHKKPPLNLNIQLNQHMLHRSLSSNSMLSKNLDSEYLHDQDFLNVSSNLLYARGTVIITKDGRTIVSVGKALYELPEFQNNKLEHYIADVAQKRGLYEQGNSDSIEFEDRCQVCRKSTNSYCKKCGTPYCSRNCQSVDWIKHKSQCEPMPMLETKSSKQEKETPLTNNEKEVQQSSPLRRPHKRAEKMNEVQERNFTHMMKNSENTRAKEDGLLKNVPEYNKSQSLPENAANFHDSSKKPSVIKQVEDGKVIDSSIDVSKFKTSCSLKEKPTNNYEIELNKISNLSTHVSKPDENKKNEIKSKVISPDSSVNTESDQNKQSLISAKSKKLNEDIAFKEVELFLPRDEFTKVCISHYEEDVIFVQKIADIEKILTLSEELSKRISEGSLIEPEVKSKCGLLHENLGGVRALVLSKSPFISYFIDFGYTYETQSFMACALGELENMPNMARQVLIKNDCKEKLVLELGLELLVKPVKYNGDGSIVVEIKEESLKKIQQNTKENNVAPSVSIPSILSNLKVGDVGFIIPGLPFELVKNTFSISLIPDKFAEDFSLLLQDFFVECENLQEDPNFKPKIGEYCCGKNDNNEWFRGYISKTSPNIEMAVIDECRYMTPTSIIPMIEKYSKICSFGLILKFLSEELVTVDCSDQLTFKVLEVNSDMVKVKVIIGENNDLVIDATLTQWYPSEEMKEEDSKTIQLTSGEKVILSNYDNKNNVYLKRFDPVEIKRAMKIEEQVHSFAEKSLQPLKAFPKVGDIVMALFTDGSYYRASVKNIEEEKIQIVYIDYGNEEFTDLGHIFLLSDALKKEPRCTIKVPLCEVPNRYLATKSSKAYADKFINEGTVLTCTFEGNPVTDGVFLKHDQESLNENIYKLIMP